MFGGVYLGGMGRVCECWHRCGVGCSVVGMWTIGVVEVGVSGM